MPRDPRLDPPMGRPPFWVLAELKLFEGIFVSLTCQILCELRYSRYSEFSNNNINKLIVINY